MMHLRSPAGFLTILRLLSGALQTTPSSPDDIQHLPPCAQSTCANYVLNCYDSGQASFEDCVNMTQADVYTCAVQKCPSCVDFAMVENWVYVYGTEDLITSLWPWPSIPSCTSTSMVTETESSSTSSPSSISQFSSISTSSEASSQTSQQTSQPPTDTATITSPIAPSVVTSTIYVPLSISPIPSTTPSVTASMNLPTSTGPPPSLTNVSGLSKDARIGIGVGAGVGGAGLFSLVLALSISIKKKNGNNAPGLTTEQPPSAPHDAQSQAVSDKPELPAVQALNSTPQLASELEGSPVQHRQTLNGADAQSLHQSREEQREVQSRPTVYELDSSELERDAQSS